MHTLDFKSNEINLSICYGDRETKYESSRPLYQYRNADVLIVSCMPGPWTSLRPVPMGSHEASVIAICRKQRVWLDLQAVSPLLGL